MKEWAPDVAIAALAKYATSATPDGPATFCVCDTKVVSTQFPLAVDMDWYNKMVDSLLHVAPVMVFEVMARLSNRYVWELGPKSMKVAATGYAIVQYGLEVGKVVTLEY